MARKMRVLLRWLVAILCLAGAGYLIAQDTTGLSVLAHLSPISIAALLVLHALYLCLHAYRYQIVLRACGDDPPNFAKLFPIYMRSRILNLLAPQAGNLYRGARLKADFGIGYGRYAASLIAVAWISTCVNLVLAIPVIIIAEPSLEIGGISVLFLLALLALIAMFGPYIAVASASSLSHWRVLAVIGNHAGDVIRAAVGVLQGDDAARILGVSAALMAMACAIFYICFIALGFSPALATVILFYVLLQLGTYVSITPGNIGIQELAFGALGDVLGADAATGIMVSVLLRVTGIMSLLVLAASITVRDLLRNRTDRTVN